MASAKPYPYSCYIAASGDEERLQKKFRWLTSLVLGRSQTQGPLDLLWHLDALQVAPELVSLLGKR